ncbi:MAG: hypothetical protein GX576_02705 [Thauera phenolivorans]|uniref:Uncharacterized protein n=1 Tax=Thauera phenolivorans TaxID=1792543 RepID=A0A7X7LUY5_9RHOO|nr:cytochrome oxidase putative small subunit CydP [Thauera phenolivorans]NLF53316.1 hypothetical protein [Thauera phenolivorans]
MNRSDRRLLREISIVVVVKLMLITALWWAFFHDAGVPVDSAKMGSRIVAAQPAKLQTTSGESNAQ